MRLKILVLLAVLTFGQINTENAYPDIQDLFPKPLDDKSEPVTIKDLDIDLERIDMDKFMKNLDELEKEITVNETRRQALPYYSKSQYQRASKYIVKIKACDLSLQIIYMTRHRVRQLENEKHFNKNDTGYRVAFLFFKLRRLWRMLMDYYTMSVLKVHNIIYYTHLFDLLRIHGRIIKLYEEIQYMFWVLANVDGKYLSRRRSTTSRSTVYKTASRIPRTRSTTARFTLQTVGQGSDKQKN